MNELVVFEISRYLGIYDRLAFAHAFHITFQISSTYSYWSPHEFKSDLVAFMPSGHIGPWRSYSGEEIRRAVACMQAFHLRWNLEYPVARHRVNIGLHPKLWIIPGSNWIYRDLKDSHLREHVLSFIDGRTGLYTTKPIKFLPFSPSEWPRPAQWPPTLYSTEPNEILVGYCYSDYTVKRWELTLYSVVLSISESGGAPSLETQRTVLIHLDNIPTQPFSIMLSSRFISIFIQMSSDDLFSPFEFWVTHISSRRVWKWQVPEHTPTYIFDDWALYASNGENGSLHLTAIYLPSLLQVPYDHSIVSTVTGDEIWNSHLCGHGGGRYSVTITKDLQEPHVFNLRLTSRAQRFSLRVRLQPPLDNDSIYGRVTRIGTPIDHHEPPSPLPMETLTNAIKAGHRGITAPLDGVLDPVRDIYTTWNPSGLSAVAFNSTDDIAIVELTEGQGSGRRRLINWNAPLRTYSPSQSPKQLEYDPMSNKRDRPVFWESTVGLVLAPSRRLITSDYEYHACWF